MITLTIDNQTVQMPDGATILEAAQAAGVHIPTMCYLKGFAPSTSCMVCVVRVEGIKSLVPSCGAPAAEHMHVTTDSDEIRAARKTAVELLLSDHLGDCIGPCQLGCPAGMDIPQMLRHIAAGDDRAAIEVIKRDIPLPAILGRICPAPCEKVCRRGKIDAPVSICQLKRFAADIDLFSGEPLGLSKRVKSNKSVAIIGAGPCGLSAAYYLAENGVSCTIYDEHDAAGGMLRYGDIDRGRLPLDIVDLETQQVFKCGIIFKSGQGVGREIPFDTVCEKFDAVLVATGESTNPDKNSFALDLKDGKICVDRLSYAASRKGVFAVGGAIGSRRMAVRAVADGKEAAASILAFLDGKVYAPPKRFNSRLGNMSGEQLSVLLTAASTEPRIEPPQANAGLDETAARAEARRCLHCDCRKADNCRLRDLAEATEARQNTWAGQRKDLRVQTGGARIVYEPGKCILCGLCIQTARRHHEATGLAFDGRGFSMAVEAPFEKALSEAITTAGPDCVANCPTGALAFDKNEQNV